MHIRLWIAIYEQQVQVWIQVIHMDTIFSGEIIIDFQVIQMHQ